jgi:cytidine deaminase
LGICAERCAIFAARVRGLVDPVAAPLAAIAVHSADGAVPWPCGACRQVLREFAGDDLVILVDGPSGTVETTLGELLPRAFRLDEE